jgi:hypothetical protein
MSLLVMITLRLLKIPRKLISFYSRLLMEKGGSGREIVVLNNTGGNAIVSGALIAGGNNHGIHSRAV